MPALPQFDETRRSRALVLAIAILFAAAVVPFLGRTSLWQSDEARIAEISRRMWETGDWVVPRIGDETYSRYPPLQFWLLAATGGALGVGELSMRLPGALSAVALLLVLARLATRLAGPVAGVAASLVLASTAGFLSEAAFCRANVLLALCSTVALERFVAVIRGDARRSTVAAFWIALALGVLARGPAGVAVPGLSVAAWLCCARDVDLRRLRPVWGIPLFVAIALPWYVVVARREGLAFLEMNLLRENVEAFVSGFEHPRPIWFYLVRLPQKALPWILLAPFAWRVRRAPGVAPAGLWAVLLLLLLSASSNKRASYLSWLYPAVALTLGTAFPAIAFRWRKRLAAVGPPVALATGLLAAVYGAWIRPLRDVDGRLGIAFSRLVETHVPEGERIGTLGAIAGDPGYYFYLRRELEAGTGAPGFYLASASQRDRFVAEGGAPDVLATHRDARGRVFLLLRVGAARVSLSSARAPVP